MHMARCQGLTCLQILFPEAVIFMQFEHVRVAMCGGATSMHKAKPVKRQNSKI